MSDSTIDTYGSGTEHTTQVTAMADQNCLVNQLFSVLNTIEFDIVSLRENLEQYCADRQNQWNSQINMEADEFWASMRTDAYMEEFGITEDKEALRKRSICMSIHQSLYMDEMIEDLRDLLSIYEQLLIGDSEGIGSHLRELCGMLRELEKELEELEEFYSSARLAHAGYAVASKEDTGAREDITETESACRMLIDAIPGAVYELRRELYYYQKVDLSIGRTWNGSCS